MTTINGITEKEADTREEKMLLGFLHSEAKRIDYGQISLEVNIRNGKIDYIRSNEVTRTFKVN